MHNKYPDRIRRAEEARRQLEGQAVSSPWRQRYHFMPPAGWMNDPNGLIHYGGYYHLFYQHNPFGPQWGPMHWGHARSSDLVHWEHLPIALAPSEPYDLHERGGCFSGSAVESDGLLYLFYTGCTFEDGQLRQSQCMAYSDDGVTFHKYPGNPVIPGPPPDGSPDFRDPKVWRHGDSWYMVVGSCRDGRGKALLYRSGDLRRWRYVGVMAESDGSLGTMWECPDVFPLEDKWVLMFSPMGMGETRGLYLVGDIDYERGRFLPETMGEMDCGFDFYAPQSLATPDGRRVLLGWANSWPWMPWFSTFGPTAESGWCGALALPREVHLRADGTLRFPPLSELSSLRHERLFHGRMLLDHGRSLDLPASDDGCMELELEVDWPDGWGELEIAVRATPDGTRRTVLLCAADGAVTLDRDHADGYLRGSRCSWRRRRGTLRLRIFVDVSSVEVFVDEGDLVLSTNLYPPPGARRTTITALEARAEVREVSLWGLQSIW